MPDETQPQPPPRLVGSGPSADLVRACPSFQLGFTPAPFLSSPHAQTLYGVAREPAGRLGLRLLLSGGAGAASSSSSSSNSRSSSPSSSNGGSSSWAFRRLLVHCEDGGTIALDWWEEHRLRQQRPKARRQQSPPPPSSPPPAQPPPLPQPLPPTAPLLLVLHGLTGGSSEGYVKSLCAHATSRGFRAAAVVYRGCGGLKLTSARAYSATFTADVSCAAQQARRGFPLASSLVAVGFSLGAVILCKYLGEQDAGYWRHPGRGSGSGSGRGREGDDKGGEGKEKKNEKRFFLHSPHQGHGEGSDDLIDAAVAVSSPFCLESAGRKLSVPWTVGWIYNAGLALRLKHYMWTHRAQIFSSDKGKEENESNGGGVKGEKPAEAVVVVDRRALATSYLVSHVDDAASARANGYADREAYYADAATRKAVPHVTKTPLLFVSSADDPFLGDVPFEEIESNPRTALVVTERGGHCAFLDGEEVGEEAWVDRLALEWLARAVARKPLLVSKL